MTLALVGLLILALVVFAFVLEPVLRARPDRVELDAVALDVLPDTTPPDDPTPAADESAGGERDASPEREPGPAVAVDRRAVGDVS